MKEQKNKLLTVKQLSSHCTEKHNYKAIEKADYRVNY